jgi:hypothetical protein
MRVLPREKTRPRRRAKWIRKEGIAEHCSLAPNAVDVWSFEIRMSRYAQFIPSQIVNQNENYVGSIGSCGRGTNLTMSD